MAMNRAAFLGALLACASGVSCTIRTHSHSMYGSTTVSGTVDYYAIDTNGVIPSANIAAAGNGAAILVSYASGGHWYVETQCDFLVSGQPCQYQVTARALGGLVTNVVAEAITPNQDTAGLYPPDTAVLSSTSTTEIDAISFDTTPGDSVQLSTLLDGYSTPVSLIVWMSGSVPSSPEYAGDFVLTPTAP